MPIATLSGIRKEYPGLDRPALVDVDLEIGPGSIVVIVGANGSGKTTAMEILSGLRVPDSGTAVIDGRRVVPGGRHRFAVGVQLQDAGLPQRLKVKEAVRAVSSLYADPGDVAGVLRALGLDDRLDQMVDKLSGGWQRRLDIALACIGRPRLLILDEPTSGLDPDARTDLWEFLRDVRSRGVSVLASTHDLTEAESYADRLVVLDAGRILLDGPVDEVLRSAGGDWRVRITGADARVAHAVRALGAAPLGRGDALSVIGSRASTARLAESIQAERDAGRVGFRDVLLGPVRLEDVYAYAAARGADAAVAS